MRTAPFQTLTGAGSGRTAITRRQPFVATRPPGNRERPSLSLFGLQAWRGNQASSGPLGGTEALTRVHPQAQGANCWEEPSTQPSGSTEEASRPSVFLLLEKINVLQFLFTCLIWRYLKIATSYQLYCFILSYG